MPYDTALGNTYDSGDFATVMQVAMERADWAGFPARKAEAAARGKLRGLGLGYYIEKCGGDEPETAELKFVENDAGDGLEIRIGSVSNGQGHETAFAQVISGTLGIDAERIRLVQGDSDVTPPGMTGGSRALPVGGVAMLLASRAIIDNGKKVAAKAMEAAAADIEFDDGIFQVAGTDKYMDLFEVARAARDPANLEEGMEPGLDERHERNPEAATFPNGCHVVEVEVDPETGDLSIERYTVVDDFGAVINPVLLAGQVHGGIAQGVGQALLENVVWDADGQLVSGSYMDYAMPRADDLPPVDFTTHNVRCTTNPLGIKGAGEAGAIGAPPAVISAVCDALGVAHIDMPATPQKIWAAAQAGGKLAAE
jgi:carbon-monoxide dehydrogenase large subunit